MKFVKPFYSVLLFSLILFFAGCKNKNQEKPLRVVLNNEANYISEDGETFRAKFYSLSDNSLYFAKVQDSSGKTLTLSRTISASGERYVDLLERTEFWTKADEAFFITKNDDGTETYTNLSKAK